MDSRTVPMEDKSIFDHHKQPSRGGWNAAIFIIFVEVAERFAFYGLGGNLISYLTNVLQQPTATAARNVNLWVGLSFLFPLFGAFIADSYVGRFVTIIISSIVYFLGMVLLTLSVSVIPFHSREMAFFASLYILVIGESGHKPCVQTFAADQFDETSPQERMAKNSFFNWWYLGINVGSVSAVLVVTYVEDNVGWDIGFAILAAALAVAFVIFLIGIKKYIKQGPLGSPFTTVAQVLVAAARKWRLDETRNGRGVLYGDTLMDDGDMIVMNQTKTISRAQQFRFLDKAMIIDDIDASSNTINPWRLCTLKQVEEMKQVCGLIPVWLASLYFGLVHAQMSTFFTKQGSTMVRSIGPNFIVPPATLQCIAGFVVITFLPIYDKILVPRIRKFTGKPTGITILQRLGVGLSFAVVAMFVAALVESKRVKTASDHNLLDSPKAIVPISVWWLIPQYILLGFVDALCIVGTQHLFYDQMPEAMRSIGAAFHLANGGVGNFMSSALITIVESSSKGKWLGNNLNRSHLDYYYFLLAGIGFLNLGVFVVVAKRYVYKKVERCDERNEEEMSSFK